MKNDTTPLVTVIIPAYNHDKYVEESIVSVANQTYKNLQIIIINDGSKDNTESVIKNTIDRYRSDRLIEFYNQDNQGVCKTLNRGIKLSKGKYIACIASDDFWASDKIEKQVAFLEKNQNIGIVFTDGYYVNFLETTSVKKTDCKPEIREYFLNGVQNTHVHDKLLYNCFIPAPSVMIRKECLDVVGYFNEELKSEDYDMWLRFTMHYPIGFIDEPLVYLRKHDGNKSNLSLRSLPRIAKKVYKDYKRGPLIKTTYRHLVFYSKAAVNRTKRKFLIK